MHLTEDEDVLATLFAEELGAVLQIRRADIERVAEAMDAAGLGDACRVIGAPNQESCLYITRGAAQVYWEGGTALLRAWSETSYQIQRLRDNPDCAQQEFDRLLDVNDPGLHAQLSFDPAEEMLAPYILKAARPRIAILREQGVNGQTEMAAAFDRAGFDAVDVHMSDIIRGRVSLEKYLGFVACGGFSYGDVLGAGEGWAKSILFNARAREQFEEFFHRDDTFALGVCNGCQMMSNLRDLIPGADGWPHFVRNRSEQFEARLAMVEVMPSPSLFFTGMRGSKLPIAVAHGEGLAEFRKGQSLDRLRGLVTMRYVDNRDTPTEA